MSRTFPDSLFPVEDGFPRPLWQNVGELINRHPESQHNALWHEAANTWLAKTCAQLPAEYEITQTDNFAVVCAEPARRTRLLGKFLERTFARIMNMLGGIASDEGYGKHVVIALRDQDTYYRYISHYFPADKAHAMSAGIYLNTGYGHFVMPFDSLDEAEATAAHELTHACLSHLPIPLWLNEGLAVSVESEICGWQGLSITREAIEEHRAFWNADTIQEFWSGDSFGRPDEGNRLSYALAQYCVRALSHDFESFAAFCNHAHFSDGGERAALEYFGGSLGGLITQFWGGNDWSPRPQTWRDADRNSTGSPDGLE